MGATRARPNSPVRLFGDGCKCNVEYGSALPGGPQLETADTDLRRRVLVLYQGTTSVVPKKPQNDEGLKSVRENKI
jgi:hypothetical protein